MTLVLSAVTPWFVVQVSDRRITNLHTGKLMDSKTNKAILFSNQVAFSYTGLAELERIPTDEWLAHALFKLPKGVSLAEVTSQIVCKVEIAVRSSPVNKSVRHLAFLGVGWVPNEADGKLQGVVCKIENCYDDSGQILPTPRADFKAHVIMHNRTQIGFFSVGIPLTHAEKHRLVRDFAACARRRLGPSPTVRLFADLIRAVALRSTAVGKDLMVTMIPKRAAESGMVIVRGLGDIVFPLALDAQSRAVLQEAGKSGPAQRLAAFGQIAQRHSRETMEFAYFGADSLRPVGYAPAMVVPGVVNISEFAMATGEEALPLAEEFARKAEAARRRSVRR